MGVKYINIDPRELGIFLSREIFGRWADKTKGLPDANEWGINIRYGKEGSPNQGKLLITYVTPDDHQVMIKFSATRYVMDPEGYLKQVVTDVMDMVEQKRKEKAERSIILQPFKDKFALPSQAPFPVNSKVTH